MSNNEIITTMARENEGLQQLGRKTEYRQD